MQRVLGNILCDLDPKVNIQILNFLVNASPPIPFDIATSNFVADHIMYFLVNVSPPKGLDVATSNFVAG